MVLNVEAAIKFLIKFWVDFECCSLAAPNTLWFIIAQCFNFGSHLLCIFKIFNRRYQHFYAQNSCQCFSYIGTILCCSRAKQTNELLNRWEGISLILQLYEKWSSFNAILQTVKYNIILAFSFTTISTLALSHTLVAIRIVFVVKA